MFPAAFILLALTILQILDPGPVTASDDPELAQLFHDMMIIKSAKTGIPLEIKLNDMDGRTVSLSDFRGKIVFFNFWTTWCPTCRIEMPSMEKLHQNEEKKNLVNNCHNFPAGGADSSGSSILVV